MDELAKTKQRQREIGLKTWEKRRGTPRASADLWLTHKGKSFRLTVFGKDKYLPISDEELRKLIKKAVEEGLLDR